MIGDLITSLDALALALLAEFPPPTVVADGSFQGAPIYGRDKLDANGYASAELPRGLVDCPKCGRPERPGAVHFPSNTAMRPCAGSWRR